MSHAATPGTPGIGVTLRTAAAYVRSLTASSPVHPLSPRERSLLDQAREDFKAGRTSTMEEVTARTDAMFARYRIEKALG